MHGLLAEKGGKNWILSSIVAAFIIIPLTKSLAPELIPFDYFGVWDFHGTHLGQWLKIGLPIFAWGLVVTFALCLHQNKSKHSKAELFWSGYKRSLFAGLMEEIAFRWLLFYEAFVILAVVNWLFFGWAGLGLAEWFHMNVWGALANWTTFGALEQWIYFPGTWLIGGAMLYTNAMFRNGHKYLGIIGVLNSWFLGMFFFYVMFTYGLLAAIILHFVYDLIIFSTVALMTGR